MNNAARVEVERIGEQIRRAYEGPSWHGPAVKEVLAGITAKQAHQRHGNAHSIIELVLHILAWKSIVRSRVLGEPAGEIPANVDWPKPQGEGQVAWDAALARLERSQAELLDVLSGIEDARLAEPLAGTPWKFGDLAAGVVDHDVYHAGQIALLKKL
ncbi:MAG: DinB family protein [Acidobacteria bacterium]|nr:DinB family protein [Acidobacteriota bacterium]